MTMLATKNAHEPVSLRIQNYLEIAKDGVARALARDFINLPTKDHQDRWSKIMQITRDYAGLKFGSCGSKRYVTYYHFVISPDPKDAVDLDTLRKLTMTWCNKFFGDGVEPGLLGSPEVAIVYHDDNTNHIPHAHIVVNNCDLETGKPLHFGNDINNKTMPDSLQEMSQELGLRFFDNDEKRKKGATKGAFLTKVERGILKSNRYTWKNDLRMRIQTAMRTTVNEREFIKELNQLGVEVSPSSYINKAGERVKDYIYRLMQNPKRWHASGYRLGQAYTAEAVEKDQELHRLSHTRRNEKYQEAINSYIERESEAFKREVEEDLMNDESINEPKIEWKRVAVAPEYVPFTQITHALHVNEKYGIKSLKDYKAVGDSLSRKALQAKRLGLTSEVELYKKEFAEVKQAYQLAKRANLFINNGTSSVGLTDYVAKKIEEERAKDKEPRRKRPWDQERDQSRFYESSNRDQNHERDDHSRRSSHSR